MRRLLVVFAVLLAGLAAGSPALAHHQCPPGNEQPVDVYHPLTGEVIVELCIPIPPT